MAKVVGPLHSFEASGKIGPLVFARNRGGAYAKSWYPPVNPKSFLQTEYRRSVWSEAVHLWVNLNQSSRENWYEYAANFFGGAKSYRRNRVNAMHLFLRQQIHFLYLGITEISEPPLSPLPNYFPSFSCYWTSSGLTLSWSPAIPENCWIIVYQQRCLWNSNLYPHKGQRSHEFDSSISSPQLISPPSGNGGGPGNQPPFNANSYIHVHCYALDNFMRQTVPQFFNVKAGF
jgi:hypothetical protein